MEHKELTVQWNQGLAALAKRNEALADLQKNVREQRQVRLLVAFLHFSEYWYTYTKNVRVLLYDSVLLSHLFLFCFVFLFWFVCFSFFTGDFL
jgi:hypothetical protein